MWFSTLEEYEKEVVACGLQTAASFFAEKPTVTVGGIGMNWQAQWICPAADMERVCPRFYKRFTPRSPVTAARLSITAAGVYDAFLNGEKLGDALLAPGWTSYETRHQYQTYDLTERLVIGAENTLSVLVAEGWYRSGMAPWTEANRVRYRLPAAIFGQIELDYADGTRQVLPTDESWQVSESPLRFCNILQGEVYDARPTEYPRGAVALCAAYRENRLIPQEGVVNRAQERIAPRRLFRTPKGETVLDFGQNMTGFVSFTLQAHDGERVRLSHGEVLDGDGNFYNENYRTARSELTYICREGQQSYTPSLTFYGFRYVRLDEFPGDPAQAQFTAVEVHAAMERTGRLVSGHPLLNRLFENIVWGQKDNFLEVPTDCPQRDERLGWTGDAQVFMGAACYQFRVLPFFRKWLRDMAAEQDDRGKVGHTVPDMMRIDPECSAGWGDAACICPWQLYRMYGDRETLAEEYPLMTGWIRYITRSTTQPDLWIGGTHFGDWLAMDAPAGTRKGATDPDLIASAYYYYSTGLVIRAGRVLGEDVSAYEALAARSRAAFQRRFPDYPTQTACALAICFGLAADPLAVGRQLARLVQDNGNRLTTGFIGTPYLLHALHRTGHTELAYTLLLQEQFPSWLYSVKRGATTVWEHWDGINEQGELWDKNMNSFNHYAYGAVADWVFSVAAGIQPVEERPGFAAVRIEPHPDRRLGMLEATLETAHGTIRSRWEYDGAGVCRYTVDTPVEAELQVAGEHRRVAPGQYIFYGKE